MAYGIINADQIQSSVPNVSLGAGNSSLMKNRIINGAMVIDQRNAGASVTNNGTNLYIVDRFVGYGSVTSKFSSQQNAGSVTPPTGFTNYLGNTSLSAYTVGTSEKYLVGQRIEGFNIADLGWGTANAKTVTLSAWVYSSLTGTFGGSLLNSAENYSYPFTYSIPVANTWTSISVTIAGPTSGTWLTTNGTGVEVFFSLGSGSSVSGTAGSWSASQYFSATGATSVVGTNGATFYITGVQLEVGSSATGFEYRQYGQELALCQRYFESTFPLGTAPADNVQSTEGGGQTAYATQYSRSAAQFFKVTKRAVPTITPYAPNIASYVAGQWDIYCSGWQPASSTSAGSVTTTAFQMEVTRTSAPNYTFGQAYLAAGNWTATAEL